MSSAARVPPPPKNDVARVASLLSLSAEDLDFDFELSMNASGDRDANGVMNASGGDRSASDVMNSSKLSVADVDFR